MADHVREDIRAFLQNRCWNWVKWRRFARHGIDEFSHLLGCGWLDVAPLFFVMRLVETHRIRSSTSESLQYRDLDIPDLVVEEICHLVAEAGILVRIRMVGWRCRMKELFDGVPKSPGIARVLLHPISKMFSPGFIYLLICVAACMTVLRSYRVAPAGQPFSFKPVSLPLGGNCFRCEPAVRFWSPRFDFRPNRCDFIQRLRYNVLDLLNIPVTVCCWVWE